MGPDIHFESVPGSGTFDLDVNLEPSDVNDGTVNGKRCDSNSYQYYIQTEPKQGQQGDKGTVAYGGKRGNQFWRWALTDLGYWTAGNNFVSALPNPINYDTSVPTFSSPAVEIEPGDSRATETQVEWRNLSTAAGGGELYLRLRFGSQTLKEAVIVNDAMRQWIDTNEPPATPTNATWYGLLFEINYGNVRVWVDGAKKEVNDEFIAEAGSLVELRSNLEDTLLLGVLPIQRLFALRRGGKVPMRSAFWRQGNTQYMFLGALIDDINANLLPSGDLVFDPSINEQLDSATANADDSHTYAGNWYTHYNNATHGYVQYTGEYNNNQIDTGFRFAGFTSIAASSTIDSSTMEFYVDAIFSGGDGNQTIYADLASTSQWATGDRPNLSNVTETIATASMGAITAGQWNSTPSLNSVVQEVVDEDAPLTAMRFVLIGDTSPPSSNSGFYVRATGNSNPAKLNISWTESGIAPGAGSLSITGHAPSLALATIRDPGQGAMAINGLAPTAAVTNNLTVSPGVGTLSIEGLAPDPVESFAVLPSADTLELTGLLPTVDWTDNHARAPPVTSIALTGLAPASLTGIARDPGLGSLAIEGLAPSAEITHIRQMDVGNLAIAGLAPSVGEDKVATPGLGSLAIEGLAPSLGEDKVITPGLGALATNGLAPSIEVAQAEAPGVGSLAINGLAPSAEILHTRQMGVGSISITGQQPFLEGSGNWIAQPSVGAVVISTTDAGFINTTDMRLILTGWLPSVVIGESNSPGVDNLAITGHAPLTIHPQTAQPGADALAITGLAPVVFIASLESPTPDNLAITGLAPSAEITHTRQMGTDALSLTGLAPNANLGFGLTPGPDSLSITGLAPTIGRSRNPGQAALAISGLAPSAEIEHNRQMGLGSISITGLAPLTIKPGSNEPTVGSLGLTGHAPTLALGSVWNEVAGVSSTWSAVADPTDTWS
jgi:hypothetical protein